MSEIRQVGQRVSNQYFRHVIIENIFLIIVVGELLGLPILIYLILTPGVFAGFSMSSRSDVGAVDQSTPLRHYLSSG